MKPPFAFAPRTRLAGCVMEQAKRFVALVAPWLARPGDVKMSPVLLGVIITLLIIGAATVGYGGALVIREVAPHREIAP